MNEDAPPSVGRIMASLTRVWIPAAIAVAGIALIILGHASLAEAGGHALEAGTGVGLVIVAIIVWMVNWMFRMSVQSNRDREVEERAREFFDRKGYWPDEEP